VRGANERARARDLGLAPGSLPAGPANAITDVPGIRVGHATMIDGTDVRTGVTAVVHDDLLPAPAPDGGQPSVGSKLAAGLSVFNGFGKMVGSTQVAELGTIETPVLLTGTLSVFRVADALLSYLRERHIGDDPPGTLNPVVAETNDGYLSDIWARPVTAEHVRIALDTAASGPVAEGCVGAGTGTGALGFKAGIGTSSRVVSLTTGTVTLGVLVQANFGGTLTVLGVPVPATRAPAETISTETGLAGEQAAEGGNSCVIVLATDAALDSRHLERLASRSFAGMARAGSDFSGRSGDYALAISVTRPVSAAQPEPAAAPITASEEAAANRPAGAGSGMPAPDQTAGMAGCRVPDKDLDLLFQAAIEATEEAILNSLFMAVTTSGFRGHVRHAVSLDDVLARVTGRLTTS
jgi:D-aminopeptidase